MQHENRSEPAVEQELLWSREGHSMLNRKKYYRAQQIWRDFFLNTVSGIGTAALKKK